MLPKSFQSKLKYFLVFSKKSMDVPPYLRLIHPYHPHHCSHQHHRSHHPQQVLLAHHQQFHFREHQDPRLHVPRCTSLNSRILEIFLFLFLTKKKKKKKIDSDVSYHFKVPRNQWISISKPMYTFKQKWWAISGCKLNQKCEKRHSGTHLFNHQRHIALRDLFATFYKNRQFRNTYFNWRKNVVFLPSDRWVEKSALSSLCRQPPDECFWWISAPQPIGLYHWHSAKLRGTS